MFYPILPLWKNSPKTMPKLEKTKVHKNLLCFRIVIVKTLYFNTTQPLEEIIVLKYDIFDIGVREMH